MNLIITKSKSGFAVENKDTGSVLVKECGSPKLAADKVFGQKRFSKVNEVKYPSGKRVFRRSSEKVVEKTASKISKSKAIASTKVPYVIGADGTITVYHKGEASSIGKSHPNYNLVLRKIKGKDFKGLADLMAPAKFLVKFSVGKLSIKNGLVSYGNKLLTGYLVNRIFEMVEKGSDFTPMAKFLKNVCENPNKESGEAAFKFLENHGFPFTKDGCFLGYKRVKEDFTDFHTGTVKHEVGKVVKHPRASCDPSRLTQCSNGLHVGTFKYASTFNSDQSGHLVIVKVNPKDIVCVPNADTSWKIRVCEYKVVKIYDKNVMMEEPVYDEDV